MTIYTEYTEIGRNTVGANVHVLRWKPAIAGRLARLAANLSSIEPFYFNITGDKSQPDYLSAAFIFDRPAIYIRENDIVCCTGHELTIEAGRWSPTSRYYEILHQGRCGFTWNADLVLMDKPKEKK